MALRERTAADLRRPVVAGVVGKAAEAATLVALATLVPRLLGPADYGRFSVLLTLVALGSLALVPGGSTLAARYVPAAPAGERRALARALTLRAARARAAPFALLAVAAVALVALGRVPPVEAACVLVALALNVAATLALQADLGLGRAGVWAARYPVQNAVLVAAVLALHAGAGREGAAAAVVVAGAAGLALAAVATASLWAAVPPVPCALPPGATRFGLVQGAAGVLTQVVQRGAVLAVALLAAERETGFATEREAGFAAVATGAALAATYAVAQVFTVALPALTARHAAGTADPEAALRRMAGTLLAVVLPVAALGAAAVDAVLPVVLGPAYADAGAAFAPALAAVVLAPLAALAAAAAALRLRPEATLAGAAAGAAVFAAAALLAVPRWGAAGATAAALAGTATSAAVATARLPGAAGWRLAAVSLGGAAAVAAWGVLA
jgi:O-antigen/teichoic acid export membrane protein